MSTHDLERELERLARGQHGVFRRDQAAGLGFTHGMIEHRLACGAWIKMAAAIYALASAPATWRRQVKAAELSLAGAVVSHRAAAVLHGIDGFRPGAIDLTVRASGPSRCPFAVVHRRAVTPAIRIDRITTTPLARTVLDLAGQVPAPRLAAMFDDLVVARRLRIDDLRAEYELVAPTRCRGTGVVRWLLDDRVDGGLPAANELERALHRVLRAPGLPAAEHQASFPWWPQAPYRVDALLPAWRRIVEADGRRWHTREADFERDRARDHLAQRHGYEVTRFTYRQLVAAPQYAREVLLDIGARESAA
jgi:very-short-patch-repair endonuclease